MRTWVTLVSEESGDCGSPVVAAFCLHLCVHFEMMCRVGEESGDCNSPLGTTLCLCILHFEDETWSGRGK